MFSKTFVDNRQADDRVDQIRTDANAAQCPAQQRDAVTDREETDVKQNVLQPVEIKDHPDQKQQVVVPRDHVFGPEVQERNDRRPV